MSTDKAIAEEAVRIWKENSYSISYWEAIERAKELYKGVDKDDQRRSNRAIRKY